MESGVGTSVRSGMPFGGGQPPEGRLASAAEAILGGSSATPEFEGIPTLSFSTSGKLATVNRAVNIYSTEWGGVRSGIVVCGNVNDPTQGAAALPGGGAIRVNVALDGYRDRDLLTRFRGRPEGNTIEVMLFDKLTADQRMELFKGSELRLKQFAADAGPGVLAPLEISTWAEWPQ